MMDLLIILGVACAAVVLILYAADSSKKKKLAEKAAADRKREADKFDALPNLMHCPDCGKEVSKYAETCPNCGRPLQEVFRPGSAPSRTIISANVKDKFDMRGRKIDYVTSAGSRTAFETRAFFTENYGVVTLVVHYTDGTARTVEGKANLPKIKYYLQFVR